MIATAALIAVAGCEPAEPALAAPSQFAGRPGPGQLLFATNNDAAKALLDASKAKDKEAMRNLFGPGYDKLLSGDPVEDARGFDAFAAHAAEQYRLDKQADDKTVLIVGQKSWPFPIPILKNAEGKWFFDTAAGMEEILARRIGRDELDAIQTCRAYVLAQREYASKDRDGSGILKYAQHFRSAPGQKDGLYWEAAPDEEQSPMGPLVAEASLKGYALGQKGPGPRPYQGYFFHVLTRQGRNAPGGRYDYVINGNMIAGFAMVAAPDKYGSSGVKTFLVNHQGKVYEKDLGPKTLDLVRQMTEYNPDNTWTLVKD
jgi:hypothetical protein